MEDQVHGSYAEALFEAVLMTNETTMFPQSSCTPVKAEPFYWVANATREARSQLLCTYSPRCLNTDLLTLPNNELQRTRV